jgi:hypothetical protein
MPDAPKKKFRLLSDAQFWRLSTDAKLQYLKSAIEVSRQHPVKTGEKPKKPDPKKHG